MEKVYKALVEVDGRLESAIAGQNMFKDFQSLTYLEGQITYAPEGTLGLFVYDTAEEAKRFLLDESFYTYRGRLVVCEAAPLGNLIERKLGSTFSTFESSLRYPAILLGKEVRTDKPARPEPKFKVGDRVSPKVSFMGSEEFTIKRVLWADKNGECDWPGHMHYHCGKPKKGCILDHYWYDEDTLELALPKEEWFDVTKECVVDIIPNVGTPLSYLGVFHEGNLLLRTGNKVTTFSEWVDGYKVELLDDARFHYDCGGFRVLKKVVK